MPASPLQQLSLIRMQASCSSRCTEALSSSNKRLKSTSSTVAARRPRRAVVRASSSYSNGTPPAPASTAAAPASQAGTYEEVPGPRNAFVPGQESESRRQLFNRISPVYDEVGFAGQPGMAPGLHAQLCLWCACVATCKHAASSGERGRP